MKRFLLITLIGVLCSVVNAQDIKSAYNLSRITSYICIRHVGYETISELRDTLQSLHNQYNTVDYVVDILNAKGEGLIDPQVICDSLEGQYTRMAFLVGPHTDIGAENIASVLRKNDKAVIIGDTTKNGLQADLVLKSNDAYLTAWFDSLHQKKIIEKAAERFVRENKEMLTSRFPTAKALYMNFDQNAEYMDVLYDEARKEGVSRNDESFFYSGFTLLAEARAEVLRQMFPTEEIYYYRSQNLSIEQAINIAKEALETSQYKRLLGVKW